MRTTDFNVVMKTVLSAQPVYKLAVNHILKISQDFVEGVEFEYLITRLYLLNVNVDIDEVRVLIWKLISKGQLELTVDRKFKFIS
jgi:hypothetical protein